MAFSSESQSYVVQGAGEEEDLLSASAYQPFADLLYDHERSWFSRKGKEEEEEESYYEFYKRIWSHVPREKKISLCRAMSSACFTWLQCYCELRANCPHRKYNPDSNVRPSVLRGVRGRDWPGQNCCICMQSQESRVNTWGRECVLDFINLETVWEGIEHGLSSMESIWFDNWESGWSGEGANMIDFFHCMRENIFCNMVLLGIREDHHTFTCRFQDCIDDHGIITQFPIEGIYMQPESHEPPPQIQQTQSNMFAGVFEAVGGIDQTDKPPEGLNQILQYERDVVCDCLLHSSPSQRTSTPMPQVKEENDFDRDRTPEPEREMWEKYSRHGMPLDDHCIAELQNVCVFSEPSLD